MSKQKPLSQRYGEFLGVTDVGRGPEEKDIRPEIVALEIELAAAESRIEALERELPLDVVALHIPVTIGFLPPEEAAGPLPRGETMMTGNDVLEWLRHEINGYAPEDDGYIYILLRPGDAWRMYDALAAALARLDEAQSVAIKCARAEYEALQRAEHAESRLEKAEA